MGATAVDDWYPYPTNAADPDVHKRPIRDAEGRLVGIEYTRIDDEGGLWIVRDDFLTRDRFFHHIPADRS